MKSGFIRRIFAFFPEKIIAAVPAELQAQFDEIQLNSSIRKIRLLTIIALIVKLINPLFILFTNQHLEKEFFSLLDYSELAVIVIFNFSIVFFRKSNKKNLLWIICYLLVASLFILWEFAMSIEGAVNQIPFIFFVTIFLFTIMPDFKPKIFITYAVLYFIATVYILMLKNQNINEYFGVQSHILNIFVIILVTKILLYNSKVKTFVNTYEINKLNANLVSANTEIEKQKDDLRNYNDNLEKMVLEKTDRIVELKNAVMETIAELVEQRDDATGGHITRTSRFLKIFINAMLEKGLYSEKASSWNIEQMVLSAQLHDVGKIAIDDAILRKPEKLTTEEFELMKQHTILGGEIIKRIQDKAHEQEFLNYAFTFAVYHHEKWDGTGYPYGMKGEEIPLPARLMAIIDVYDALISERPYKKAFTHEQAVSIIKEGRGSHFDPSLTDLFLSVSGQLY
ncbi:MAG: HD domain-containing protein [Treponema sp.]|nr:HD domain-containing protein [Treponema sp.]